MLRLGSLLLAVALLAVVNTCADAKMASGVSSNVDYGTYTFEMYLSDFGVSIKPSEHDRRKDIFHKELARVTTHNSKKMGWAEGINKFSHLTTDERKQQLHGRSKGMDLKHKPKHVKPLPVDFTMDAVEKLPPSVDWRGAGIVTAVKDQGSCGSCWAFASTSVMESHVAKATGLLFDLSVTQMTACAPNPDSCGGTGGCQGSTAELAFDYAASSSGFLQEYQYPYANYYGVNSNCSLPSTSTVAGITGYVKLPENNYQALMNAVAKLGPIAVSVDASAWGSYSGGIFDGCNQENPDIDHAVVLVGYGEEDGQKYWLVRNSWSPLWGEKGYIRLARSDDEQAKCGADVTPASGTACAADLSPQKVCGTCGIIFDSAYPTGAYVN